MSEEKEYNQSSAEKNWVIILKSYIQIILSIAVIIGVVKSYMLGPTFGLDLVKNIKDIYALPGGTGFGFGLIFLAVLAFGHLLSIILILFTIILFVLAPLFYVQILFITFCIGTAITKESFSFIKLINTFICLFGSTIQIYFPFLIYSATLAIILGITNTLQKFKEIKDDINL